MVKSLLPFLRRSLSTLPRIAEVHLPHRVKNNTLFPAFDVTIPEVPFCEFLWSELNTHGHLPGLVCGVTGRTLLHGEIKEKSLEVSRSLRGLGLKKGDILAILLPNCIEYPLLVQGCLHSGIGVTPLNPVYTPHEIARQLLAAQSTVLVSHSSLLEKVEATRGLYPALQHIIIVEDRPTTSGGRPTADTLTWDRFVASTTGPLPEQEPVDIHKDVAVLPFSSGTTGSPKGVILSQHNLITNVATITANDPDYMIRAAGRIQDVTIGVLPMYHIFGLNVTTSGTLHMGAKQVVVPSFNPAQYVGMMAEHKPTFLHLVPPLVSFLANNSLVTRDHLASLRQVNVGAAPSGPELIRQFYKKAPTYVKYKEGWGSTEVAGGATGIYRPCGLKAGSVNQLLPNLRLQVRDLSTDLPLEAGQTGEILVKGPHVMLGYSNNPKANLETFDKDGWMRTGDIGYFDSEGFLFIVDRLKELIKVKGFQVAPAELEDVLRGLEGVADVGVVGVESERDGEAPRAFIVRKEGRNLTQQEVEEYLKVQVAPHKQLTGGVEFVQAIPKSAAGKILRKDLALMYREQQKKKL